MIAFYCQETYVYAKMKIGTQAIFKKLRGLLISSFWSCNCDFDNRSKFEK